MSSQNPPPDQPQSNPTPESRKKEKKREKPSQSQASRAAKALAQQRTSSQRSSPTNSSQPNSSHPRSQEKTEQRINKVLAAAGLGSRRQVDELIEQGRVEINGKAITQVGTKVDPNRDAITVDGELLKKHRPVYFALNKPEGVLCTNRDPQGRPRVIDFVPNQSRLFPVGRLDASSTGLILLTNDGELAQRLAHPKHGISKRYAVVVAGQVEVDDLKRLQRGIYIAEGKTKVDQAKLKKVRKASSELEITLSEGKNREIRRVLARLGHKVLSLQRIAIGPLKLADLPEGAYRPLSNQEVTGLYEAVDEIRKARKAERKARKKRLAESGISTPDEDDNASEPSTFKPTKKKPTLQNPKRKKRPTQDFDNDILDEDILDNDDNDNDENLDAQSILIRDSADPEAYDEAMDEFLMPPKKRFGSVIGQESFEDEDRVADATYTGFSNDDDEDDFDDEFESFDDEQDSHSNNDSDRQPRRNTMRSNRNRSDGRNPKTENARTYRSNTGRSTSTGKSSSTSKSSSTTRNSAAPRQNTGRKGFKSSPQKGTKKSGGRRGRTNNNPSSSGGKPSNSKPKRGKR